MIKETVERNYPNLFLIGVAKSGTSSLHDILHQHSKIFMSKPKEPRFFSRDSIYCKGENWYIKENFKNLGEEEVIGESTPTYLSLHTKTIPRIQKFRKTEKTKFLAILRNPIDRAYSHYWFNRNTKTHLQEKLSFVDALALESHETRMNDYLYREGIIQYDYFKNGLYFKPVKAFMNAFGAENVKCVIFENLYKKDFVGEISRIQEFLGVEQESLNPVKKKESVLIRSRYLRGIQRCLLKTQKNTTLPYLSNWIKAFRMRIIAFNRVPFKYPKMDLEIRKMLVEKYRQDILELSELIDTDLTFWLD